MSVLKYVSGQLKEGLSLSDLEDGAARWLGRLGSEEGGVSPTDLQSARCFEQCDEEGVWTGSCVVILGYASSDSARRARGARDPADSADPADPSGLLDPKRLRVEYLEPQREGMWFDYTDEKLAEERRAGIAKTRYFEFEHWKLADGVNPKEYADIIDVWFKYVVDNKERLFEEWVSARYYRMLDADGAPNEGYGMIFEYASHEEFQAYKKRRRHSYNTNTGDYLVYRDNDPYQFFDAGSVGTDGLWPIRPDLWFARGSPN